MIRVLRHKAYVRFLETNWVDATLAQSLAGSIMNKTKTNKGGVNIQNTQREKQVETRNRQLPGGS
jgi:hypothetical protein